MLASSSGQRTRRRARRRSSLRWLLCLTLGPCASFFAEQARAEARPRPILEVDAEASRVVDARASERLVALETADVEVPPPPGVAVNPPLYFRVVTLPRALLRVELWELGRPYGARSVSSTGTQSLEARRIALAAGELARQLRERRVLEIAAERREGAARHVPSAEPDGFPIYGRVAWSGGATATTIGVSDAWLVGPHVDAELRFSSGQRLTLGGAWLVGREAGAAESRSVRWLEVKLALAKILPLGRGVGLELGVATALASLRADSAGDGGQEPLDTWSARGGALARLELPVARHVAIGFGPDVGAILRPLSFDGPGGTSDRMGGLWLGGALTIAVDPAPR